MLVVNTQATTHVDMLYAYAVALQFVLQFVDTIAKSFKITHVEYLTTNMEV